MDIPTDRQYPQDYELNCVSTHLLSDFRRLICTVVCLPKMCLCPAVNAILLDLRIDINRNPYARIYGSDWLSSCNRYYSSLDDRYKLLREQCLYSARLAFIVIILYPIHWSSQPIVSIDLSMSLFRQSLLRGQCNCGSIHHDC